MIQRVNKLRINLCCVYDIQPFILDVGNQNNILHLNPKFIKLKLDDELPQNLNYLRGNILENCSSTGVVRGSLSLYILKKSPHEDSN